VAGTWAARLRGPATLTLTPLAALRAGDRRAVVREAEELLAWLRPDVGTRTVRWEPD
jgi:hypothetical protein